MWLTWDGDTGKKAKVLPSHGSMLLGVSWLGATWLKDNWDQVWLSHFDLSLKWICENMSMDLEASFVYPSIGHYASHGSGILLAERKAVWKEWWVQEGVRKRPDHPKDVHREIWGWSRAQPGTGKLQTQCLEEVDLAAMDFVLNWKTYFQPGKDEALSSEPIADGSAPGASSSSSGAVEPRKLTQEEMQHMFDQRRMVGDEETTSKRSRRQRRAQLLQSGQRCFTQDVLQAGSFSVPVRY